MPNTYKRKSAVSTSVVDAALSKQTTDIIGPVTNTLAELGWWDKLDEAEQDAVMAEGRALSVAMLQYGTSRLKIGEHLAKLQSVLEPHNLFGKFLKNFHFSKRTAYRYIAGFNNAKARLPKTVLDAAMARGVNLIGESELKPLGIYTQAVEQLPPPVNPTPVQAETWLNQVEQVRKQTRETEGSTPYAVTVNTDPQLLLKECYRFVSLRYKRLPSNTKTRAAWVRNLVGMLLSDMGIAGQQAFAPTVVPEDYKAQRGRPVMAQSA